MKEKSKKKLLGKRNVITIGDGIKSSRGKPTGQVAVVVGVTKKVPRWALRKQDMIPEKIDGEITDVIEVGEIRLLEDPTAKFRPSPAGVSVGHYQITAGTLGAWVKRNCHWHILSNNHVLANVNQGQQGDGILQPGHADGGSHPADMIATLTEFVPISMAGEQSDCPIGQTITAIFNWLAGLFGRKTRLSAYVSADENNKVDCALAIASAESEVHATVLGIGDITGAGEALVGDEVQKAGRTTGVTKATIGQKNVTVSVQMGNGLVATFEDQMMIQSPGFSKPGDSGSAILNMNKQIVGLLFAGSDTVTIANRYANVKEALKITSP